MNLPAFSAEASVYRTRGHYSVFSSEMENGWSGDSIQPAYFPGTETQRGCSQCLGAVARDLIFCDASASAIAVAACVATGWFTFGISCAAAGVALSAALGTCDLASLVGIGYCAAGDDCCPKLCGVLNPLDPGSGCCDADEACVDKNDPNSRDGCCPSSQRVCGGPMLRPRVLVLRRSLLPPRQSLLRNFVLPRGGALLRR